jgi:hypothetical protein
MSRYKTDFEQDYYGNNYTGKVPLEERILMYQMCREDPDLADYITKTGKFKHLKTVEELLKIESNKNKS